MTDIDWSKAPEGAVKQVKRKRSPIFHWVNEEGKLWSNNLNKWSIDPSPEFYETIATRPEPRKTVADAVEYYDGVWPSCDTICMRYNYREDWFFSTHRPDNEVIWASSYQVCTRQEFEQEVARREGEKWTHKFGSGKCYIKESEPDFEGYVVLVSERYGYILARLDELKPIKPTITKAEAWDKAVLTGNMSHITDNYEVKDND